MEATNKRLSKNIRRKTNQEIVELSGEQPKESFSIFQKFSRIQLLVCGFILLVLAGSILLTLPISQDQGESQNFLDALFTATSAVSTTGLIVEDTGTYYSMTGQVIILILIQIGGLGYMIFIILILSLVRKQLSIHSSLFMQESLPGLNNDNFVKVARLVIIYTITIEIIGAILYTLCWRSDYSFTEAVYQGIFHSISAFCTAGFSLFSDSLVAYQSDIKINIITFFISIAGSIGFIVIYDIARTMTGRRGSMKFNRLSTHSKMVLLINSTLILSGCILIYITESINTKLDPENRILTTLFQSISASSTTGFNSVDIALYNRASFLVIIILMYIGAAPASTAGGIKSTTFYIICASVVSYLKGRRDTNSWYRRIPVEIIRAAYTVAFLGVALIILDLMLLLLFEDHSFMNLLFEIVSAFGTVGLSAGITSGLTSWGKIIIILTMFTGRLGTLAIGSFFLGKKEIVSFHYPDDDFYVG